MLKVEKLADTFLEFSVSKALKELTSASNNKRGTQK